LHLSYFGDQPDPFQERPDDVTLTIEKGTKSIGLNTCVDKLADRIWTYDWMWVLDDDLAGDLATLDRFVEIVEEYELDLAHLRSAAAHTSHTTLHANSRTWRCASPRLSSRWRHASRGARLSCACRI
jgi:hypothetical protein